jgi:hypothetical protein
MALNFYFTFTWPQYQLGNNEAWLSEGNINYNTILQLYLFCRNLYEVPYAQMFIALRKNSQLNRRLTNNPS